MSKCINLQSIGISTIYKNYKADGIGIITPENVVSDMIDLIPDSLWNRDTKFLDIACKSGNFLREIYFRLMECEDLKKYKPNKEDRSEYIRKNQIYGICMNISDEYISARNVFGCLQNEYNIKYISNWVEAVKHTDKKNKLNITFMKNKIQEAFGENMKFNVIVGNPPYNNDIYLDFVIKSKALGAEQICMITPAKWQAKGGEKNEQFRKEIVPYISDIVYYPMASDVFNIAEPGGIDYYLIDKDKHDSKNITIVCNNKEFSQEKHASKYKNTYNDVVNSILEKTSGKSILEVLERKENSSSFLRSYYLHESYKTTHKKPDKLNYLEVMSGSNTKGYCSKLALYTTDNLDKYKVTQTVMVSAGVWADIPNYGMNPLNKLGKNQVPIGSYPIIKFFDTEDECDYFISYCNTKLVKFLHYLGIVGTTESSDFWKFVPDPGAFDHIFTDAELYKKYNLTEEEIAIIESVIKERN